MVRRTAMLFLLFCCLSFSLTAQVIYVAPGATGNGSSWAEASGSFQAALESAASGTQIWLAAGTYYPTSCTDCTPTDQAVYFQIPDGVQVYGGFVGGETALEQRDWTANPTVLSGDIGQNNTVEDNAFTIVYFQNVSESTVLDGCILKNGAAQDTMPADAVSHNKSGAAIYNMGSVRSNPVIRNCRFLDNQSANYGAAIYNYGRDGGIASPEIRNCFFDNNHAVSSGGAIYNDAGQLDGTSSPLIADCYFQNNESIFGGGIYNNGFNGVTEPTIINCQFYNNFASSIAGACYSFSKGTGQANPQIINSIFSGNASSSAGAVYALANGGYARPHIINSVFYENSANTGGAVYCNESEGGDVEVSLYNNIFWGNSAFYNNTFHMSGNGTPVMNLFNTIIDATDCEAIAQLDSTDQLNCVGTVLFNENPMFDNPEQYDFHVPENSPAVDAGNNQVIVDNNISIDLDSLDRINNATVDLGPFEYATSVYMPTTIVQQPVGQSLCESDLLQLTVLTGGTQPVDYQWFVNGQMITGATQDVLTISAISTTDQGGYYVEMTTQNGTILQSETAIVAITPLATPTIEIVATAEVICENETVTFSIANQNHAGDSPVFEWKKNGAVVATGTTDYQAEGLNDGDQIDCEMVSSESCTTTNVATSNTITIEVVDEVVPTANLTPNLTEICAGQPVFFTAMFTNGGDNPVIEWLQNGEIIETGNTSIVINDLTSTDMVQVAITSSANCAGGAVLSNPVSIAVSDIQDMTIGIATSNMTTICAGEMINFEANVQNGGDGLTYQWKINNENVGNDENLFLTDALANGDVVTCEVTSALPCLTANPVLSNELAITVLPTTILTADIAADATIACEGEAVTFTVTAQNAGQMPHYQWLLNGSPIGTDTSVFTINTLTETDEVSCTITSSSPCQLVNTVTTNALSINLANQVTPTVNLQASATTICAGEPVSFTAAIFNGGATPDIQWLLNGEVVAEDVLSFMVEAYSEGDTVWCQVVSAAPCATIDPVLSNPGVIAVNENINIEIAVVPDAPEFCENETMSFTAMAVNAGDEPTFEWFVNGVEVQVGDAVFNSDEIAIDDLVTCRLTSDLPCVVNNGVESVPAEFTIIPTLFPSVTVLVAQDSLCPDEPILFTVNLINEGNNPQIRWQINGELTTATGPELMIDTLSENDEVVVILEVEEPCVFASPIISEPRIIHFDDCAVGTKTVFDNESIRVFPNPANASFQLQLMGYAGEVQFVLMDIFGNQLQSDVFQVYNADFHYFCHLDNLTAGTYFAMIRGKDKSAVARVVVTKN